jgi:hypothetical protein
MSVAVSPVAEPARYDRLIVGSSPIALIEALYLGLQDHRCLVVDRADRIGGQWALEDVPHYSNVELGPHYFGTTRPAIEVLNLLGLQMESVRPRERWFLSDRFLGKTHVGFERRWVESVSNGYTNAGPIGRAKSLLRFAAGAAKNDLNPFASRRHLIFPRLGLPAMLARLSALLQAAGVDVWLGRELTDVRIDTRGGSATAMIDGKLVDCGQIVVTNFSRLGGLTVDGNRLPVDRATRIKLLQLRLVVDDPGGPAFSILKFPKNAHVIDYVADVTCHATAGAGAPPHGRVLLARMDAHQPQNEDVLAKVMDLLRAKGFVGPKAQVIWHGWHASDRGYRSDTDWRILAGLAGDRIRPLETSSMGTALTRHQARWRPVFESRRAAMAGGT